MAGAHTLSDAEVAIIKRMLTLSPKLSNQAILSYFTRPGRDLNHRLISEIQNGRWPSISPAPLAETLNFLAASLIFRWPEAREFYEIESNSPTLVPIAHLHLDWWPVGQGLFHSGRLQSPNGQNFEWVYDCGSTSKAKFRDAAIAKYRKQNSGRINLVVLSHFDRDHINGIEALVRGRQIDILLLPYLPLFERLLVAISEGIDTADPLFEFFVDPVVYLRAIDGDISEIVFVPAGSPDDGPPSEEGEPLSPFDFPVGEPKIEEGKAPRQADQDPIAEGADQTGTRFLRRGGRIVIPHLWEFVPYNDAELHSKATPKFISRARCIARNFVDQEHGRGKALELLKKLYERTFGGGARPRNLASLFLYSGPVGEHIKLASCHANAAMRFNKSEDNFAQLSTGDGYLKTTAQLNALQEYLRIDRRFERAGIFQVMHHGSKSNWHEGVAAAAEPAASIFSSSPAHAPFRHPHAEVLRDFWSWSPVQVHEEQGFHVLATLGV